MSDIYACGGTSEVNPGAVHRTRPIYASPPSIYAAETAILLEGAFACVPLPKWSFACRSCKRAVHRQEHHIPVRIAPQIHTGGDSTPLRETSQRGLNTRTDKTPTNRPPPSQQQTTGGRTPPSRG